MSREEHAREGAQAVVPDDQILDVAVVRPRGSTLAGIIGATAGAGMGGNNSTAWGVAGAMLATHANSASRGSDPSIVLALSATRLYVLGRSRTGLVGGWKDLHQIAHIDRSSLEARSRRSGIVHVIELTDTTTGTTLYFEARPVGGLGLKNLLGELDG